MLEALLERERRALGRVLVVVGQDQPVRLRLDAGAPAARRARSCRRRAPARRRSWRACCPARSGPHPCGRRASWTHHGASTLNILLISAHMANLIHTCYRITDIDRSVAFYKALGFEEVGRIPIRDEAINVFMNLPGDGDIAAAGADLQPRRRLLRDRTGYGHIAITAEDLDATLEQLAGQGIEPEKPPYACARAVAPVLRARPGRLPDRADRAAERVGDDRLAPGRTSWLMSFGTPWSTKLITRGMMGSPSGRVGPIFGETCSSWSLFSSSSRPRSILGWATGRYLAALLPAASLVAWVVSYAVDPPPGTDEVDVLPGLWILGSAIAVAVCLGGTAFTRRSRRPPVAKR